MGNLPPCYSMTQLGCGWVILGMIEKSAVSAEGGLTPYANWNSICKTKLQIRSRVRSRCTWSSESILCFPSKRKEIVFRTCLRHLWFSCPLFRRRKFFKNLVWFKENNETMHIFARSWSRAPLLNWACLSRERNTDDTKNLAANHSPILNVLLDLSMWYINFSVFLNWPKSLMKNHFWSD